MFARFVACPALLLLAALAPPAGAQDAVDRLEVYPPQVRLAGQHATARLLVTATSGTRQLDGTDQATFTSSAPGVVRVDGNVLTALATGQAIITARLGNHTATATVEAVAADKPRAVNLEHDVIPLLTRFRCNSGPCHGKAHGQNGFALSLLGFYPDFDNDALTREARGRRIFPAAPKQSLLLEKPTGQVSHGGGKRFEPDGPEYQTLLRWIQSGMPRKPADAAHLERISIYPPQRTMQPKQRQRLLVMAHYSDGTTQDVTALADFQSSEDTFVGVDEQGLIKTGPLPGEATIMARFLGQIATCHVLIPLEPPVPESVYAQLPRNNFIDEQIWTKLASLGITPSAPCDDATYLRRVYLDLIGRLPTPDEARNFLSDQAGDKRRKLVDHLLEQPEYAEFWANKWSDLLLPNPYRVGIKATFNFDHWIRDSFRHNKPYDQFVRELVTAQGSTFRNGNVTLFRDRREPEELTTIVSQLFLGVRLDCAKCHHHPFEKWGQEHFYSFAAYFAKVGRKGRGVSPPISGSEEMFFATDKGDVRHPLTGEVMSPAPLFGTAPEVGDDPRQALAAWMTSDDNPYFAEVMANRVWADLMGRGIVEPVDDLRATNPPSNEPLLKALAAEFRRQKYDLKALLRTITASYAYSLSAVPGERNVSDTRNYSRHYRQRLRAETVLDAIGAITGQPDDLPAMPPGASAMSAWTRRINSLTLDTFGRPDPNQDPPCERTPETTAQQSLHMMNAQAIQTKLGSDQGTAARLAKSDRPPKEVVEELYLLVYSRYPTKEEYAAVLPLYQGQQANRRALTEDLLWALLNTPEFLFKN